MRGSSDDLAHAGSILPGVGCRGQNPGAGAASLDVAYVEQLEVNAVETDIPEIVEAARAGVDDDEATAAVAGAVAAVVAGAVAVIVVDAVAVNVADAVAVTVAVAVAVAAAFEDDTTVPTAAADAAAAAARSVPVPIPRCLEAFRGKIG